MPEPRPSGLHAALIFPYSALRTLPLFWFGKPHTELRVAAKVLTGYTFDNPHLRFANLFGDEFAISVDSPKYSHGSALDKEIRKRFGVIHPHQYWDLKVWDSKGVTAVYGADFVAAYDDSIPDGILTALFDLTEQFSRGSVRCSDCGAMVDARNPAGRYFAGTYCAACWSGDAGQHKGGGGWKAVEARETYE